MKISKYGVRMQLSERRIEPPIVATNLEVVAALDRAVRVGSREKDFAAFVRPDSHLRRQSDIWHASGRTPFVSVQYRNEGKDLPSFYADREGVLNMIHDEARKQGFESFPISRFGEEIVELDPMAIAGLGAGLIYFDVCNNTDDVKEQKNRVCVHGYVGPQRKTVMKLKELAAANKCELDIKFSHCVSGKSKDREFELNDGISTYGLVAPRTRIIMSWKGEDNGKSVPLVGSIDEILFKDHLNTIDRFIGKIISQQRRYGMPRGPLFEGDDYVSRMSATFSSDVPFVYKTPKGEKSLLASFNYTHL